MKPPWQAERTVDPREARELIESQFPELRPAEVENFALTSWDNTTYLVNGEQIFRFPRRKIATHLMDTEMRVLPRLAVRVSLPIPKPQWFGRASRSYPWSFSGYRILPGATACSFALQAEERMALASPLGQFLRQLHAVPSAEIRSWDVPRDEIRRLEVEYRNPATVDRLRSLERSGTIDQAEPLIRALEDRKHLRPHGPVVLAHGDLYARHLLLQRGRSRNLEAVAETVDAAVDEAPDEAADVAPTISLSGIIDWGDLHLGHAAVDLAIAHIFLPAESHREFRAAYGPIEDETWELARIRAIWHSAAVALFAADQRDTDLAREVSFSLQNVLPR